MVEGKIHKQGNRFVVSISQSEMERLGLKEGDRVSLQPAEPETRASLRTELQKALDESWEQNEAGYRYLADR